MTGVCFVRKPPVWQGLLGGEGYWELVDLLPRWRPHAAVGSGPGQDLVGENGTPHLPLRQEAWVHSPTPLCLS